MNDQHFQPTIFQAIDVCRTDEDDLSLPELAELADRLEDDAELRTTFARSQRLDAAIGESFRNVDVPPGLKQRLLAAAQQAELPDDADVFEQCLDAAPVSESDAVTLADRQGSAKPQRSKPLKRVVVGGSVAATITLAVVCAAVFYPRPQPVTVGDVIQAARIWWDESAQHPMQQVSVPAAQLAEYPLPRELDIVDSRVAIFGWQTYRTEYGVATIYDLTKPGARDALLFVVPSSANFDLDRFLRSQPSEKSEKCFGVAFRDGVLYVLIVDGNEQYYESFFKPLPPVT